MFVASILVVLNISIFFSTMSKIRKRCEPGIRAPSILLCSLYPIICCAALTTIILPKGWLICHTVMHMCFTVGGVLFRQLCFKYVGSEMNYVKETDGASVSINTPPCCCCCLFLPSLVPSKAKFCMLRYMVWQMPFVQGCIMLVLNLIYYREQVTFQEKSQLILKQEISALCLPLPTLSLPLCVSFLANRQWPQELYHSVSIYFIPFLVCSILIGIWALNIIVRMVNAIHSEYGLMVCSHNTTTNINPIPTSLHVTIHCNSPIVIVLQKKMFCLQLILLLCKLQYMLLDTQLNHITLGSYYPINHTIYKQSKCNPNNILTVTPPPPPWATVLWQH